MKIAAKLCYDGSYFAGFARQHNIKNTVVNELEAALKSINIKTTIIGAGRTDKGVHAVGQTICFELPDYWDDLAKLQKIVNDKINPKMSLYAIRKACSDFEVRFGAKRRTYRYLIRQKPYSPFWARYTWHNSGNWDAAKDAIKLFEGEHNFAYFCKADRSKEQNTIKTINKAKLAKWQDGVVLLFEAQGFIRSQVRMMTSFLAEIASGNLTKNELLLQLERKQKFAIKPAPPEGLYLSKVKYDNF